MARCHAAKEKEPRQPGSSHEKPGTPSFASGRRLAVTTRRATADPGTFADHLEEARRLVAAMAAAPPVMALDDPPLSEEFERGRWFPLPSEAVRELHELSSHRARRSLGR